MDDLNIEIGLISQGEKVAALLRKEIAEGEFAVGQRLENERQLALRFGVSRGTVRQALKILTQERLIIRHQGRGTFIADPAFASVSGRTALIGALVYEKEYYFGAILQGAVSQSGLRGYILTTGSNMSGESEAQHVEAFIKHRIHGVIMAPKQEHSMESYQRLVKEGVPVVLLDTKLDNCNEDFVGVDDRKGAFLACEHLINLGHKRICYVGYQNPEKVDGQWERKSGFMLASKKLNDGSLTPFFAEMSDDNFSESLVSLLSGDERPTGIVAYNDIWALRVLNAARRSGLNVPEDLSVVGFDNSALAKDHDPTITTIDPQPQEMGRLLVNMLIEKIKNPQPRPKQSILVMPNLIQGATTARPPR